MKNKFMKILGIALTLAVLVGLMLPAMPASAGTLSWSNVDMPTQLTDNSSTSLVTFAADGKTVFAWDNNSQVLIKSTDAGISWLPPGKVGTDLGNDIIALAVSPRFATDSIVIAASADTFYYSNNAGKSFVTDQIDLYEDTLMGDITSLAISYNWDDVLAIALGTTGGVMVSVGSAFRPTDIDYYTLAVAFAPDYASSDMILALVNGEGSAILSLAIAGKNDIMDVEYDVEATFWNNADEPSPVGSDAGFMAFPNNYTSDDNAIVFVSLSGVDAYRVDLNAENYDSAATNLRLDKKSTAASYSIAYKGTAEDGTLAVGLSDKIWTSTNADTVDGAATWSKSKKTFGQDFEVVFSPTDNKLYAASQNGANEFGSAFAVSTDYTSFNGLSRISVWTLEYTDINFSNYSGAGQATQYVVISDKMEGPGHVATYQILMKTTDSGKTWQAIFAESNIDEECINGVSVTGDTIYLNFKNSEGNSNVIKKSTDGGNTFAPPITLRRNIDTLALIDASTYFYAANGQEIYKSSNDREPIATLDTENNIAVLINIPGFFIVKTVGGPVFFSADAVTFKKLGDLNPVNVTFDVPGRTVWAVDGDNVLWSFNVDTSTAWAKGKTINTDNNIPVSTLSLGPDGSMYVIATWDNDTDSQMYRSVDINGPDSFEGIPDSSIVALDSLEGEMHGGPGPVTLVSNASGNTVYVITNLLDDNPPAGKGLAVRVKSYTDTLVAGPTVIAPVANAQIPGSFTFQWSPVTAGDKKLTYTYQIATDDKFAGVITPDGATTKASTYYATDLTPGMSYFFRAKVKGIPDDSTLSSKWSATVPFVVKLDSIISGGTGWISPAAGTSDAPQTPNFQWAAVPGATSYELVIDGGTPISLTDTVYTLTTPLAYGSTHTWKVRAVANGNAGNWVSGIFTVKAAPVVTPPPTSTPAPVKYFDPNSGQYFDTQAQLDAFQAQWKITHTPTPTPATPAYIWVIIVIGAILVVAVIVLIARTRRV
jgi:hypothetical protein